MDARQSNEATNLPMEVPKTLIALFHNAEGDEPKSSLKLTKIHTCPDIYFIKNFLSQIDIDYLDECITGHEDELRPGKIRRYAGNDTAILVDASDFESSMKVLNKGGDANIRLVETKIAGEMVTLECFALMLYAF